MDVSGKPVNLESLEMAKKRNKKVYITDIAINKVPFIQYKGFTDNQNHIMRELAQEVLAVSKDENNSNEVAITCDLGVDNPLEVYGVSFGTEHEVDVMESYVLNDVEYDFKPLEIFVPDPDYKVDKKELEKSIEKNKAIIARARESRKRYLQKV